MDKHAISESELKSKVDTTGATVRWVRIGFIGTYGEDFYHMISSETTSEGIDVVLVTNHRVKILRAKRKQVTFFCGGTQKRKLNVAIIRTLHFHHPTWCAYVNFTLEHPFAPLKQHLLQIREGELNQWAQTQENIDCLINRSGTLVVNVKRLDIRKPTEDIEKYFVLSMISDGKQRSFRIHRLVWSAFNEKPIPKDFTIDHFDGQRHNNHLSNLRIATPSQQNQNKTTPVFSCIRSFEYRQKGGPWVTCESHALACEQLRISKRKLRKLLTGETSMTTKGAEARYKAIDDRYDANGIKEVWIPIQGTCYFLSNLPQDTTTGKGERISEVTNSGVRVPVRFKPKPSGYIYIGIGGNKQDYLHRVIFETVNKRKILEGCDIDHVDGQKWNNFPSNLQELTKKQHMEKTNGKAVIADGVFYPSIAAAAKIYNMVSRTLGQILKRGDQKDRFQYATDSIAVNHHDAAVNSEVPLGQKRPRETDVAIEEDQPSAKRHIGVKMST